MAPVPLIVAVAAEQWIDLILRRGAELRAAGVLSIGCDGNSVVLAPAEPVIDATGDEESSIDTDDGNPWNSPASYPTGRVPSFGDEPVDEPDRMPPIPSFGDH